MTMPLGLLFQKQVNGTKTINVRQVFVTPLSR